MYSSVAQANQARQKGDEPDDANSSVLGLGSPGALLGSYIVNPATPTPPLLIDQLALHCFLVSLATLFVTYHIIQSALTGPLAPAGRCESVEAV